MVINRKKMAREKIEQIKQGFSAFAETSEVAEIIEKEVSSLNIDIFIDHTPMGSWFIPVTENE